MAFRRRMALQPINSIKHVIDTSGGLTSSTSDNVIVNAVPNVDPTVFVPGNVRVGSKINGFYLSVYVIGSTGAPLTGPIDWFLIKSHEGQISSIPNPGATGVSKIRNQIIHEEKGLSGSGDGTAMVFKGVIAVPKGMRRMREGDTWRVDLRATDPDVLNFCVKAIYKSYF